MGRRIKSIALSILLAVFGAFVLSGPVFADPVEDDPSTIVTPTDPDETPSDGDTDSADDEDAEDDGEDEEKATCYEQVGSLGWAICPGAGLFGKIIDGAYTILNDLVKINPIPTESDAPIHVVWDYFRNITNTLFVIFFLVIIFSQVTGFGINNYGIKKTLPRIIITAILVNLSYIICTLAVDISNILGSAFQDFFLNIQNIALENGSISDAASLSVSDLVAQLLGIGAVGTVAIAVSGGLGSVIWMLLPVLLAGLISIVSALITMAARQAFIFLLVMASPLALIAYMLPNTEKWYKKWYSAIFQMLVFYPMFSILFGASQLCGLVIITSASDWLGVILGIAVKIIPLFLAIPMMKMSGSILGKIDGFMHRTTRPLTDTFGRFAMSHRELNRQKYLNRKPTLPSNHLAQYLNNQRIKREFDTAELAANNKDKGTTKAMESWYRRDGTLNQRGLTHLLNERTRMQNKNSRDNILIDFDEGFADDGTDKRVRVRDLGKVRRANDDFKESVIKSHAVESRKRYVTLNNLENRAQVIHDNVEKSNSSIRRQVLQTFNMNADQIDTITQKKSAYDAAARKVDAGQTLTADEQAAYNAGDLTVSERAVYDASKKAINATLADAITAKRRVDKEARQNYFELYDDTPPGSIPGDKLVEAIDNKDYNSMVAAINVMSKRGDHNQIIDLLAKNSSKLTGDENIRIQKELADTCLGMKQEDSILWAWAKANMIRRGKNDPKIEKFIDLRSFIQGAPMPGDHLDASNPEDLANIKMIDMHEILTNVKDGKIFAGTDRTVFNQFMKDGSAGTVDPDRYLFTEIKHLRASACSGQMDGEQLAAFNNYFTYGFGTKYQNSLFDRNKDRVKANIDKYFKDMNASQLSSTKTATFEKFNDALLAIEPDNYTEKGGKRVSNIILNNLQNEIEALNKNNMTDRRGAMNPSIRKWLGINPD